MKQTFGKAKASCCHVITNSSIRAEERNEMKLTFKQPYFLLCGSCYWCASYLSLRGTVEIRLSCMNGKVDEVVPISDNEIYQFGYDVISGGRSPMRGVKDNNTWEKWQIKLILYHSPAYI